jgi:hypothetical protein
MRISLTDEDAWLPVFREAKTNSTDARNDSGALATHLNFITDKIAYLDASRIIKNTIEYVDFFIDFMAIFSPSENTQKQPRSAQFPPSFAVFSAIGCW